MYVSIQCDYGKYMHFAANIKWPDKSFTVLHLLHFVAVGTKSCDIFDKIHFFAEMDSWHDDTCRIKRWSYSVQL